jgi:hypothetical protein
VSFLGDFKDMFVALKIKVFRKTSIECGVLQQLGGVSCDTATLATIPK